MKNSVMAGSDAMGTYDDFEWHRYPMEVVKNFKKDHQPTDVNQHLHPSLTAGPLTPAKFGEWIQQYSVVYPEYEGLRANCQQFSAWAYEALTDAFWWDRRQAATSSTLRLFVGPGDRKGTKGKLATLSAASAKESVKPSVTTAVTSSLAVGKVAEKIGIKAITTFATELAINA